MMEGGLLLLIVTTFHTSLHVYMILSLAFLLSNTGTGSSSHASLSLLEAPG